MLSAITQSAIGQVSTNFLFRYRTPIINDTTRCDLSPLFLWWAAQLEAQAVASSNQNPASANVFTTNTVRPMEPWLHITGQIVQDDTQGWIVVGTVESAPGKGRFIKALVVHPPRKEMARFARQTTLLNNPLPPPDYSAQEADIKVQDKRAFVANTIGDEDLENYYAMAAAEARRELEARKKRDQAIAAERTGFLESLGDFPRDWQTYQVDIFAFNTRRQLNGLPVFDAGLSFSN